MPSPSPGNFEPTRWSLVLRAQAVDEDERRESLCELCRSYWYPLYALLRRSGRSVEDAEDLTQDFFIRLLDGRLIGVADPARGKFRTLLLKALRQLEVDGWRSDHALKRGGGVKALSIDRLEAEERLLADESEGSSPELAFDRAWAAALMERTWERLRERYDTPELAALFAELAPRLSGGGGGETLADVGARLGMAEDAVKKAFSRLRLRFGEALRAEVAETTGSRQAAEEELGHLLTLFP